MVVIVIVDVTMHRKFWLLKNWKKKKKKPKITNVDGLSVDWSAQFWISCYFLNFGGVRNAYKIYLWPLGQLKLPGNSNHDVQGLNPLPHLRCIKKNRNANKIHPNIWIFNGTHGSVFVEGPVKILKCWKFRNSLCF